MPWWSEHCDYVHGSHDMSEGKLLSAREIDLLTPLMSRLTVDTCGASGVCGIGAHPARDQLEVTRSLLP